jgi:hypothetical protein
MILVAIENLRKYYQKQIEDRILKQKEKDKPITLDLHNNLSLKIIRIVRSIEEEYKPILSFIKDKYPWDEKVQAIPENFLSRNDVSQSLRGILLIKRYLNH